MQEHNAIGIPVWRLVRTRGESLRVYAPTRLAFVEGTFRNPLDYSHLNKVDKERIDVWVRTFSKTIGTLDFCWENSMSEFVPKTDRELHGLCSATFERGGAVEVISPRELSVGELSRVSHVWTKTSRRTRYLIEHDICNELKVPWIYLLTLYNFDPLRTVFLAGTQEVANQFRLCMSDATDLFEYTTHDIVLADQYDWETIYRSLESQEPERYWRPSD